MSGGGIRFDGTINLGHILTFIGCLGSAGVAYSTMDKRVVVLEEARAYQTILDKKQDEDRAQYRAQVRDDYKDINNKLDRMLDRTVFTKGK